MTVQVQIREERPKDVDAVRAVNRDAFGQNQEANIVDALRANGGVMLSLVAALPAGQIVGHILYSPIEVGASVTGAALGPMAVATEFQRQGIGSQLIESGTAVLGAQGCPCITVVGHPDYYPRFGFQPASDYGIRCEWEVGDAFMMLVLDPAKMTGVSGLAKYRPEFSTVLS